MTAPGPVLEDGAEECPWHLEYLSWTQHFDPASGARFWHNQWLDQSTWSRPEEIPEDPPLPPLPAGPAPTAGRKRPREGPVPEAVGAAPGGPQGRGSPGKRVRPAGGAQPTLTPPPAAGDTEVVGEGALVRQGAPPDAEALADTVHSGAIKQYDARKGFGFIHIEQPAGQDHIRAYFHVSWVLDHAEAPPAEGDRCTCVLVPNDRDPSKWSAKKVKRLAELGTVASYDLARGYGFIAFDRGVKAYVHSSWHSGILHEGDRVFAICEQGDKGRHSAKELRRLEPGAQKGKGKGEGKGKGDGGGKGKEGGKGKDATSGAKGGKIEWVAPREETSWRGGKGAARADWAEESWTDGGGKGGKGQPKVWRRDSDWGEDWQEDWGGGEWKESWADDWKGGGWKADWQGDWGGDWKVKDKAWADTTWEKPIGGKGAKAKGGTPPVVRVLRPGANIW
eukprot:TRINITY_DN31213_c0_g1_i1.p1 TRINITY_DN31213_c0_g1~~TRINITY_DN31213_c0_g1_i1.p1  ORF type:complete len:476 (+),score=127.10 TRINITY_DN31213_c0_g1_i1:82-1428(+)